ncbi:MAG: FAD-dependent oxidoreductase [Promethearchaeota archaeon]
MKRLIIIGGGFGGFYFAKKLEKYKQLELVLVNPTEFFEYTPLIHEVCVGEIPSNTVKIYYQNSLKRTNFIKSKVKKIIFKKKEIVLDNNKYISYDYLTICSGALPRKQIEGSENLPTLHNLNDALKIKQILLKMLKKKKCVFSVIGEGATGTELVGELGTYKNRFNKNFKIHHFLFFKNYFMNYPGFDYVIKKRMKQLGINVHPLEPVVKINNNLIITKKRTYHSDIIIICTGVKPVIIESDISFESGYLVNNFCELKETENVYVIGDAALFPFKGKYAPNLAQVAVKQANFIVKDIIRKEKNKRRKKLNLKIDFFVISIGKHFGLGRIFDKFTLKSVVFWILKRTYYFFNIIQLAKKISIIKYYLISLFLSKRFLREKNG